MRISALFGMSRALRVRAAVGLLVFALAGAASAGTVTIDFNDTVPASNTDGYEWYQSPYSEDGFDLSSIDGAVFVDEDFLSLGRASDYFVLTALATFVIDQANGDPFGLVSLDLAFAYPYSDSDSVAFTLTGHQSGGGTVVRNVSASSFETFTFDSTSWGSLTSLDIRTTTDMWTDGAIDNIVLETSAVSVVPLPPAAWMGLGLLGGLGLIRRLRRHTGPGPDRRVERVTSSQRRSSLRAAREEGAVI